MRNLQAIAALVVTALSVAIVSPARAEMDMKSGVESRTHKAAGTVTKVDPRKGSVTIAHGPVQSLGWPAMTMTFVAQDRKLLDGVRPGAKVEFEFVQLGARYVITSVK